MTDTTTAVAEAPAAADQAAPASSTSASAPPDQVATSSASCSDGVGEEATGSGQAADDQATRVDETRLDPPPAAAADQVPTPPRGPCLLDRLVARVTAAREDFLALPVHVPEGVRMAAAAKAVAVEGEADQAVAQLHALGLSSLLELDADTFHALFSVLARHSAPLPGATETATA